MVRQTKQAKHRAMWYELDSITVYFMDFQGNPNIRVKLAEYKTAIDFDLSKNHAAIVYAAVIHGVPSDAYGKVTGQKLKNWLKWVYAYKVPDSDSSLGQCFRRIRERHELFKNMRNVEELPQLPADTKFIIMVTSNGSWEEHNIVCEIASEMVGVHLGNNHNGGRGCYFTHGISMTLQQIMDNSMLFMIYRLPSQEVNLGRGTDLDCFVSIFLPPS